MINMLSKNPDNSPVWNDLLKVRNIYLKERSMVVGNGRSTSFWHDRWCGLVSLADKFPELYKISDKHECPVEYMRLKNWHLSFRRWLHEDLQCQFRRLHDIVFRYGICSDKDHPKWDWKKYDIFRLNLLISIYVCMIMALVLRGFGQLKFH
jgi:hypothetical protein